MLKRYSLILIIFFTVIILLLLTASFIYQTKQGASNELPSFIKQQPSLTANKPTNFADNVGQESLLQLPLSQGLERVTKKPFGLKISPQNSPVAPEKFSGLHAGVDFEILPSEEDVAVPVLAVCAGPLVYKQLVSGYGGVAIQRCVLDKQTVTALYGHLKLDGIAAKLSTEISAGDQIGILGKGYGSETSGERKHLHLGIHRGATIDLRGYVQSPPELEEWVDVMKYLK